MVLTEAFASGTPVVASNIAGYRDVVDHNSNGLLVPVGDAVELGEAMRALALDPARRTRMAAAARERAERFGWSRVTSEVTEVYAQALEVPQPESRRARLAQRVGVMPTEPGPRVPPQRLPSLEPKEPSAGRRRAARAARRILVGTGAVAGVGLTALALQRLGIESIGRALLAATPVWVLVGFALMCASMLLRAEAWHAILQAALPGTRVRRRDTARATMIGVLMSATLPARLGEPSRALILSRRVGRVRDRFPVVLGTMISQTLLNILALVVLGSVMFATVGLFNGNEDALVVATIAPVVVLALVLSMPWILRRGTPTRFQRVQQAAAAVRGAMVQVRRGLEVFRPSWAAGPRSCS
jgi:phosphatidyl-myo-inositol alpha-mannosyltransferase